MRFSVCLPATRAASVGATVWSIRTQTLTDWELLVVGQGDDRAVREAVEAAGGGDPRIRYLRIERRGSSRARTAAMHEASGDIIAMTDDDCEARPDWLAVIDQVFRQEPEVALVGGSMLAPPRAPVWPASCPAFEPTEALYDPAASGRKPPPGWDWIGANFAMRRGVMEQVGDFDPCLGVGGDFPAAGDTDYKLRIEALSLITRSTPRAVVDHTYGWRYGVSAVLHHQRTHARGNGALAAKLTLLGDPRGREWLATTRRLTWSNWRRTGRAWRLLADLRVRWHFVRAYRECLHDYWVGPNGLLFRVSAVERARGLRTQRA